MLFVPACFITQSLPLLPFGVVPELIGVVRIIAGSIPRSQHTDLIILAIHFYIVAAFSDITVVTEIVPIYKIIRTPILYIGRSIYILPIAKAFSHRARSVQNQHYVKRSGLAWHCCYLIRGISLQREGVAIFLTAAHAFIYSDIVLCVGNATLRLARCCQCAHGHQSY